VATNSISAACYLIAAGCNECTDSKVRNAQPSCYHVFTKGKIVPDVIQTGIMHLAYLGTVVNK
jgi:hypothetical protein